MIHRDDYIWQRLMSNTIWIKVNTSVKKMEVFFVFDRFVGRLKVVFSFTTYEKKHQDTSHCSTCSMNLVLWTIFDHLISCTSGSFSRYFVNSERWRYYKWPSHRATRWSYNCSYKSWDHQCTFVSLLNDVRWWANWCYSAHDTMRLS